MPIGEVVITALGVTVVLGNVIVWIVARKYDDGYDYGIAMPNPRQDVIFLGATSLWRAEQDAQDYVEVYDLIERGG